MLDDTEPTTRDSSDESRSASKSPFRTALAAEDGLAESFNSGHFSIHDADDDNWFGFGPPSKPRTGSSAASATMHSMASTVTLTSHEGSESFHGSFSNSHHRSPKTKTPRRSPTKGCLSTSSNKNDMSSQARLIASLPLSTAGGELLEDSIERVRKRSLSRNSRKPKKECSPKDGQKGTYYQPSKASMGNSTLNQPPRKPQRIRARSKGPVRRRKSHDASITSTQSAHMERTALSPKGKRSKSCEPNGAVRKGLHKSPKAKKKSVALHPSESSRSRKKPSSLKSTDTDLEDAATNASFHESWPRVQQKEPQRRQKERQHSETGASTAVTKPSSERPKAGEKIKRKRPTSKTRKKETSKEERNKVVAEKRQHPTSNIHEVITFFEVMAAHKAEGPPPERGSFKKSNSARCVRKSLEPNANASLGSASTHGAPSSRLLASSGENVDVDGILDPSNKRRQRRSSAPAKALAAFHQYRKTVGNDNASESTEPPPSPPPEKIMLDVSELAALEIIRLGSDNSLKLDLFDLMNHLKRQQQKNGDAGKSR